MKNIVLLFLALFTVTAMAAGQTTWKADKSHTMINFSVAHMVISEVTGQFRDFDAAIETPKEDFTDAKINVTIRAKSIDTGSNGRDNHLRSAEFFNADVDSLITFSSTRIEKTGADTYLIHGALSMRGVTKEITLDAKLKGIIQGRKGRMAAFKASASIARKEWGLNWNRAIEAGGLLVGENVDLTIVAEFNEIKS